MNDNNDGQQLKKTFACQIEGCNVICNSLNGFSSHLRQIHSTNLFDYKIQYENFQLLKCVECGKEISAIDKKGMKFSFAKYIKAKYCTQQCMFASDQYKESQRQSFAKTERGLAIANNVVNAKQKYLKEETTAVSSLPNKKQQQTAIVSSSPTITKNIHKIYDEFLSEYFTIDQVNLTNFGVEINNVVIYHCDIELHNESHISSAYHQNMQNDLKLNGKQLIIIYSDEWASKKEQIKDLLKAKLNLCSQRLFARNCSVNQIANKNIVDHFLNKYHIQGKGIQYVVMFGLCFNDELIGVITLGKHHRDSQITVLNRLCFRSDVYVIGGTSKLMSHVTRWCKENEIDEIISWSDNRWSSGSVYEKIGFQLDENLKRDYSYVINNITRTSKQSQKKSNTKCPPNITEREWALQHGLLRIWDCGKKKWKYQIN